MLIKSVRLPTVPPTPQVKLTTPPRKVPIKLKQLLTEPPLKETPPLNLRVLRPTLKLTMLLRLLPPLLTKLQSDEIF